MNITGSDEDAGECLNDTYLSAWNSIPPDEPRTYFFAFLARIIRCASLDVCRKRGRQKRTAALTELTRELEECIASPSDADSQADDRELAAALNDFLGTLGCADEKRVSAQILVWRIPSVRSRRGFISVKAK